MKVLLGTIGNFSDGFIAVLGSFYFHVIKYKNPQDGYWRRQESLKNDSRSAQSPILEKLKRTPVALLCVERVWTGVLFLYIEYMVMFGIAIVMRDSSNRLF